MTDSTSNANPKLVALPEKPIKIPRLNVNVSVFPAFTMDAIKKKMQAMKLEKDNAMDRADACEQQAKDANLRAERVRTLSFHYF